MNANNLIDSFIESVACLEGIGANSAALIVICRCAERIGVAISPEHAKSMALVLSDLVRDVVIDSSKE